MRAFKDLRDSTKCMVRMRRRTSAIAARPRTREYKRRGAAPTRVNQHFFRRRLNFIFALRRTAANTPLMHSDRRAPQLRHTNQQFVGARAGNAADAYTFESILAVHTINENVHKRKLAKKTEKKKKNKTNICLCVCREFENRFLFYLKCWYTKSIFPEMQ